MSSLSGAMNTAVSALRAQSSATSAISNNIANTGTVAYKTTDTSFYSLVTTDNSSKSIGSGGVKAEPNQNLLAQGNIVEATTATDLAIDGNGFFIVTDAAEDGVIYYTRSGDFTTDENGDLVNANGYYLQGYPTDKDGNAIGSTSSLGALETINLTGIGASASASTSVSIDGNLPADAEVGDTFATTIEVYDSLGQAHTIPLTWEKTAANEWSLTAGDPYTTDASVATGTASVSATLTFASDGSLASLSPADVTLAITGWSTGASDSTIDLDLGDVGKSNGVTQFVSASTTPSIEDYSTTTDGVAYGEFIGVEISSDGIVTANFDNGVSYAIYKIPLATFANADGLAAVSGNAYRKTTTSGQPVVTFPGSGAAGTLSGYALEESNADTADELVKLIRAQQAYSTASQVISTVQEMFDALLRASA